MFEGDLAGSSRGELLSARTAVEASAGYVASSGLPERVTVERAVSCSSIAAQWPTACSSSRWRCVPTRSVITVVPDSGTGELVGLAGTISLQIADGVHAYERAYTLPSGE